MLVRAGANFLSPISTAVSFARRLVRVWRTKQAHYTLLLVAIPKTRAHTHPSYVVLLHFGILVKQSSLLCCRYCDVRDWQPKGLLISTGDEAAANARPGPGFTGWQPFPKSSIILRSSANIHKRFLRSGEGWRMFVKSVVDMRLQTELLC